MAFFLPQLTYDESGAQISSSNNTKSVQSDAINVLDNSTVTCKGLRFIHLNVRSVLSKITEIRLIAFKCTPTVIPLSETWLDSTVSNSEISIEGYDVIRNDRNRRTGEVNLYINNKIAYKIKDDPFMINLETLWIDLLLPSTKPITVGACQRPPDNTTFLDKLNSNLTALDTSKKNIILGDMNICYNNHNSGITKQYKQILDLNSYTQIIATPTRITEHTANILDHVICNRDYIITHSSVIETGISDHFLTYCTRKRKQISIGRQKTIKIRSLSNYN